LGSPPNVASVLAAEAMSITTWLIVTPASDEFHTVKVAGRSAPQQGKRYPHNYPPQHERKNQTEWAGILPHYFSGSHQHSAELGIKSLALPHSIT
jgi:hypothetical protein